MGYPCAHERVDDDLLHPQHGLLHDLLPPPAPFRQALDVLEQRLAHGYGVALLELGVLGEVLLLAVVGQVDLRVERLRCVGAGGGAHVGRVVVVDLELRSDQHPDSDIELAAVVEQRPLNCLLCDPAS